MSVTITPTETTTTVVVTLPNGDHFVLTEGQDELTYDNSTPEE